MEDYKTVDIRGADGSGFIANIFSVTRMEESEFCYFFFSDKRMIAGFNKTEVTHNFAGSSFFFKVSAAATVAKDDSDEPLF